mmetsp:Transcript_937/g.1413  ORF Transcript_937/g.1413 Transcript_937/m.1413 type:complete len:208 (-) Transcript_937:73-696(-)
MSSLSRLTEPRDLNDIFRSTVASSGNKSFRRANIFSEKGLLTTKPFAPFWPNSVRSTTDRLKLPLGIIGWAIRNDPGIGACKGTTFPFLSCEEFRVESIAPVPSNLPQILFKSLRPLKFQFSHSNFSIFSYFRLLKIVLAHSSNDFSIDVGFIRSGSSNGELFIASVTSHTRTFPSLRSQSDEFSASIAFDAGKRSNLRDISSKALY